MHIVLKNKLNSRELFVDIGIILLVFLTCFPLTLVLPSMIRHIMQMIAMVCFALGLILNPRKELFLCFVVVLSLITLRVYGIWHFKKDITSCVFNVFAGLAFCFWGVIANLEKDHTKVKRFFTFVLIILFITSLTTLVGLEKYPLSVRELGRSDTGYGGITGDSFNALKRVYRLNNIAGWNQLYGMVYMIPAIMISVVKRRFRLIFLLILLSFEFCIIKSQLTLAVLLSFLLIALILITPSRNRIKLAFVILLIGLLFVILLNMGDLIESFAGFLSSKGMGMVSNKLYDLYNLMNGSVEGDALSRFDRYAKSIETFSHHPLLGQVVYGISSVEQFSYHSDFLDMMAFYGLFGLIGDIILVYVYMKTIKHYDHDTKWIGLSLVIGFVAMYILNPVWYSPQILIGVTWTPAYIVAVNKTVHINRVSAY